MDASILLEYGWVLLVLIGLEGILAADNAVVMAVMVKHLPKDQQRKALILRITWSICFPLFQLTNHFLLGYCMANSSDRSSLPAVYRF